jgi:hypothetical protein
MKNDFGLSYNATLPALGESSQGLRILSEVWSTGRETLTVNVEGIAGAVYDLAVWNAQQIRSVDGAKVVEVPGKGTIARVPIAGQNPGSVARENIVFHF